MVEEKTEAMKKVEEAIISLYEEDERKARQQKLKPPTTRPLAVVDSWPKLSIEKLQPPAQRPPAPEEVHRLTYKAIGIQRPSEGLKESYYITLTLIEFRRSRERAPGFSEDRED